MAPVPVTVRMDIAYDGSFTYGFQKQESLPSVQGIVEGALKAVSGSFIPVVGASRTDRGVHALHNVVSFVLRDDALFERVARRLPIMMPEWLTIRSCVRESANFSARFSTLGKTYAYIFIKEGQWTPFLARYAYRLEYPVKTAAMNDAAHAMLGTHDFKGFGNIDPSRRHRDTTCTLSAADVVETDKLVIFTVSADHFLYHMVRRMAYFVLKAGQGRIGAETWNEAFTGPDVPYTRQVMAAGGLYLVAVDYP
ncbi:MAG: tRNA pseudouridine synthase A [Caldiserica bacterium]|nr:tRNA pseudouridine synthase A [Caldisericota bacterium]